MPVLHTTSGDLKGYFYDGVYIYKGIPYAYADRFQMPVPSKWDGVKDATNYGFVCPLQNQDTPNGELMVPHRYWPQDEHCQSLNIWTNKLDPEAKKPVLVWFHGGGYAAGSSIEQVAYDGVSIAKKGDSILVSVNHRLNILGYLDLSPFGEKYKNSANAGHADMVAALQWVHDNIAAFGGDPENVTIFGQSGGGMKVATLMNTPAADGEEYFATSLLFASARWGNGEGIYNYNKEAQEILKTMLHQADDGQGVNMFNKEHKMPVFCPIGNAATFSDPSYHLPHFYELFAKWARSVVGIGINVNQTEFDPALPNPTSLAVAAGRKLDRAEVFRLFYEKMSFRYGQLQQQRYAAMDTDYAARLYRLGETHSFVDGRTKVRFEGTICGVLPTGELEVRHRDGQMHRYLFKEIEYTITGIG